MSHLDEEAAGWCKAVAAYNCLYRAGCGSSWNAPKDDPVTSRGRMMPDKKPPETPEPDDRDTEPNPVDDENRDTEPCPVPIHPAKSPPRYGRYGPLYWHDWWR